MSTTYYFYDGENLLQEHDGAGTTTAHYVTEPNGSVISQRRDGVTQSYHYDGNGSTTELTDESGAVTDSVRNSAFGETTEQSGTSSFPYRFVGRAGNYFDLDISALVMRHADYEPREGCFRRRRASLRGFANYIAFHNNPGNADPDLTDIEPRVAELINGLRGAASQATHLALVGAPPVVGGGGLGGGGSTSWISYYCLLPPARCYGSCYCSWSRGNLGLRMILLAAQHQCCAFSCLIGCADWFLQPDAMARCLNTYVRSMGGERSEPTSCECS